MQLLIVSHVGKRWCNKIYWSCCYEFYVVETLAEYVYIPIKYTTKAGQQNYNGTQMERFMILLKTHTIKIFIQILVKYVFEYTQSRDIYNEMIKEFELGYSSTK